MANASKFLEELEKEKKKRKKEGKDTSSLEPIAPVKPDLSGNPQVDSFFNALNTEREKLRRREEITDSFAPVRSAVTVSDSGTKHGGGVGSFTVKSEEDDSLLDFFDKGAFSDGYQFGDVTKAILGTVGDVGVGAVKGVMKMGEGIGDAAQYGVAAVADAFGGDEFAEKVRKNAQRTAVDDAFAPVTDYLDKYSVLGRTMNSASEAIGQIGAIIATGGLAAGVGGAGAAAAATTGMMAVSGFGTGTGEAYKGGAAEGEAELYGAISGAADAITEMLSGGLGKGVKAVGLSHGLGGLDDILAKKLSSKISNTIAKNAVQFGVKASGEGLEEVLAGTAQAVGKKLTYMEEEELSQIIADENLLEQFVVGAMASGVAQVPSVAQANKAGADYVTGRTNNEQAVIDRVVEQRVKDAETDLGGVKLTAKQRQDIEEQAASDMERGRIDIDTIEEALGGDEYQTYQNTVKEEDALRKEYEELGALKEPTLAEKTRYEELHQKASEFSSDERRNTLKSKLSERVAEMAKSDRLSESYAERARRSEYFTEDASRYKSDAAKKTVQNLVDSKIANNTGRTHDMAETVAKIAEDKGIVFNFTNNQKLRESGRAASVAEGVIINGYKDADGITVNLDSPKAWDFIVGHEVTHALEGTAEYTALADAVKVYAQTKGDYDSRRADIASLYAEGTDVDSELTADMVGELFGDEQFVSELSVKHQNVFQRVFAEIKHLYKMVTAGSKEARQLERVKRNFEKAYRAQAQTAKAEQTQHSLAVVDAIEPKTGGWHRTATTDEAKAAYPKLWDVSAEESDSRNPTQIKNTVNTYRKIYDHLKAEGFNGTILDASSGLGFGTQAGIEEYGFDVEDIEPYPDSKYHPKYTDYSKLDKKYDAIISSFVLNVLPQDQRDALVVKMGELLNDGGRMFVNVRSNDVNQLAKNPNNIQLGEMEFIETSRGSYQKGFKKPELVAYLQDALGDGFTVEPTSLQSNVAAIVTKKGGAQFSLTQDSEGRQLSEGQRKYFNKSKVTDENGNLKVVYHGSPADFNEFSLAYLGTNGTAEGYGFYFTDKKSIADVYSKGHEGQRDENHKGRLFEVYLDIKKPLSDTEVTMSRAQFKKFLTELNKQVDEDGEPLEVLSNYGDVAWEGLNNVLNYAMEIEYDGGDSDVNMVHSIINGVGNLETVLNVLRKTTGYDGIIVEDATWGGDQTIYVAFHPEQIKNVDNLNPTGDPDIRRSLSDANAPVGGRGVAARELRYQGEDVAPVQKTEDHFRDDTNMVSADDVAPIPGEHSEIDRLNAEYDAARAEFDTLSADVQNRYTEMTPEEQEQAMEAVLASGERLKAAQDALHAVQQDGLASYTDADVPPEVDAPYYGEEEPLPMPDDPMADRDEKEVGNRSVKAYQYLNPEVKPFFREEANAMLGDLRRSTKGERFMSEDGKWTGVERILSYDLAGLKDRYGYSYEQLEKGIQAIIDDEGAENNAVSKRIELLIHDRLAKGYVDAYSGIEIPANTEYLDFLREKQITEYNDAAFDALVADADAHVPPIAEDIAPVAEAGRVREAAFAVDAPIFEDADDADGGETIAAEIPAAEDTQTDDGHIRTVRERLEAKLRNFETELKNNKRLRAEASAEYDRQIAELETEYEGLSNKATKKANAMLRRIERLVRFKGNNDADYAKRISDLEERVAKVSVEIKAGESPTEQANMRRELHANIVENIRNNFEVRGYDMDEVFKGAKNLATFSTVDNTPQRVMEKALGYKQGQILADLTVNRTAQHETEGIRWLNQFTDRKNGLLAQISRQYNIKPGSKESAAAQMYAEGFYVSKHDEIIKYGDAELAADFPDAKVQANIKGLARDGRIRAIYDATLDAINESRVRNAYPAIQKLDNYFLHFRAMEDTFSRIGLPFNPEKIKVFDLPTDLNGVTADLKPGQPYFASAQHRRGKRTSFDLLGGLEKYLSSAKNQIYHIDDIQTLRALRNHIADTYGQSKGLESLDSLTEEEAQERIKEVYGSHMSTFASFLNDEANHIAGKKDMVDRALESRVGRRGMAFFDELNRQVGANMVGYNISSSLTNLLAPVQAFAKMNKAAFVKGFAQTVTNRIGGIFGRGDNFAQDSSVMVRREGAKRFKRNWWQRRQDNAYALMGAVDSVMTEVIARAKYNELTGKGMSSEQAHYEADKWVSRLMGDRSLGQQPLLFNSKMLGMITKFQLEVRNQLDSQFYDTIKEAEVATANIENAAKRNAVKAAKITSTFVQLAVAQHLFGKVFESIAGYNPAFDIIEAIIKAAGWDDDEEDDDTVLDNIGQGVLSLVEDMPYSSVLTGGRVPIESALPIVQFVKGKDSYGNEKSRLETLAEALPYYFLPGGYGQIKKTIGGLGMYSDEHPVAGSYTDAGKLRFPVGTEPLDIAQAAVFGQYSSGNARDYFDDERSPLYKNQIEEMLGADMTIQEYWNYRDGLKGLDKNEEKAAYINSLDLPAWKKTYLLNSMLDRKENVTIDDYDKYGSLDEMDFANGSPEKYALLQSEGVTYQQYMTFGDKKKDAYGWAAKNPEKYSFIQDIGYSIDDYAKATDTEKDAWNWAYNNPEKYLVSRAVSDDLFTYRGYTDALNDIKADKDADGKSISGSRKDKVVDYLNGLDLDYGAKVILLKSEYPSEDSYNYDIIDYLNERDDITAEEMTVILTELGFKVSADGTITWD